jgi:APA family basic amino acid/polyamine antiporter
MKIKLKRELGLKEVVFYGIGVILGAGIYALIGPACELAGNALWISFLIGAFIATFTGLSYAELATMFPKAAAEYVYVRNAFGSRLLAFLIGWLIVFSGMVSAATVSLGFASYFTELLGRFISIDKNLIAPVAIILIGLLSYVNFLGIEESSRFNMVFTLITALGLAIIIAIGIPYFGRVNYFESAKGLRGIFSAAALIFFAYIGFEDIANITEETKEPRKTIPKALILSIFITSLFYVLTSISVVSIVNASELSASHAPLAFASSKVLGENAYFLISFMALFATASTVLVILLVTSRMLYGMAKEKSLPESIALIHKKTKVPWVAVTISMIVSMIFVLPANIKFVAEITNLVVFVTFISVNASLIWLRYMMPRMKRAFRVPLNIGNYPLTAFFAIFLNFFMIFQFDIHLIAFGLFVVVIGIALYLILKKFSLIE